MPDDIKFITNFNQVYDVDKRCVFAALNLMYLGNFNFLNHSSHVLWIDGVMGKLFLKHRLKILNLKKLPGSKFLAGIINSGNLKSVSVLGDCPAEFKDYLMKKDVVLGQCYALENFEIDRADLKIFGDLESSVIISLPSPKQEKLANALIEYNKDIQKIFCVGGAVHMIADPSLECPELLRNLNLEWLFRLKTDPLRRSKRLITQIIGVFFNYRYLRKLNFTRISSARCADE